ncbi:O-antigen ligase family protein (plasmid) [Rhizobium rosettiformans]|uniref:O-antigen ligase family protein n=1 Tax=Rhizobium rosettiformans TaxID=1368430 RepID=A0ABX7F3J5_9HYPH|nr:O-antigen ligase family protein [Rhizobium rosettiformans]QRF54346.1 O-antigen ligase family protein [Rhizobium rosettiformans]
MDMMTRPFVNSISMWVAIAILVCTPLALGGNRPLVWPIVLAILSLTLVLNAAVLMAISAKPAVSLASFRLEVLLIITFLCFAVLQIVPLRNLSGLDAYGLPANQTLSVAPAESFLFLLTWLNVFILGYLVLQFTRNETRSIEFLNLLFWVVVIHAALGFVLFHEFEDATIIGPKWAYLGSMTGGFVNRNTFATFLASGAAVGTALVLRDLKSDSGPRTGAKIASSLFKLMGLLLIMAVLFGTGSRMGLFVGVLGVFLTIFIVLPKQIGAGRPVAKLLAMVVIALSVLAVILWGYGGQTIERLGSVERASDVRFELYEQTWSMIMARPWSGFGGGAYELAFPLFHQPEVSVDLLWQKAHNSYLGLWADYGLVFGTMPWLILLIVFVRLAICFLSRSTPDYAAASAIVVAIIAMIHALVDFSLEIQGYALLFTAILATGASRLTLDQRQSQ